MVVATLTGMGWGWFGHPMAEKKKLIKGWFGPWGWLWANPHFFYFLFFMGFGPWGGPNHPHGPKPFDQFFFLAIWGWGEGSSATPDRSRGHLFFFSFFFFLSF
jgi:hypothetical protein